MENLTYDEWLAGLDLSFVLDARYNELTDELLPGKVYKRVKKQ